jgi:hypothetical protein
LLRYRGPGVVNTEVKIPDNVRKTQLAKFCTHNVYLIYPQWHSNVLMNVFLCCRDTGAGIMYKTNVVAWELYQWCLLVSTITTYLQISKDSIARLVSTTH